MKVLLIRPHAPNTLSFIGLIDCEPLELEYLYTELKTRKIDGYIYDGLLEETSVRDTILREEPDVVAVTGYNTQVRLILRFCKEAKEWNPQVITIVGGVHAQLNYTDFYDPNIDYIFRSESVHDFGELLTGAPLSQINGLLYREKGEYVLNPLTPTDINALPIPDRSFFHAHKERYRYLHMVGIATIKTSFSCPYACNFCYCTLLSGGRYRARDLSLVIEELKTIDSDYVQIVDDDFLADKARLWEFVRLVREHNIQKTYTCYARADFVAENPELVQALVEVGVRYFLVGLEAVDDEVLKGMNKQVTFDQNRRCVEVIQKAGGNCLALMIAHLDADEEYFERLYRFVETLKLQYVTVSIFTPLKGTAIYEQYKDKITSKSEVDFDFLHLTLEPETLTRAQFYRAYRKLFIRIYRLAKREGIYDFINIDFYWRMLSSYLRRKMKGLD